MSHTTLWRQANSGRAENDRRASGKRSQDEWKTIAGRAEKRSQDERRTIVERATTAGRSLGERRTNDPVGQ
ncbi:hypothetical protein GE061_009403 [Apolygus lucorum]|uniref:Uncharacterized protein n=1 Tax=Apolygus lucorum TaxID=248454 RepID=A0A8S9Y023_APOLU|nr:hypothetical protein GE061_009403 [Apolygus lucorum]